MYFNRFYGSGYSEDGGILSRDPRGKVWAEYVCGVCGHVHDMDVTSTWCTTFQKRERVCPSCRCMSPEDKVRNLESELESLTAEKSRIQIQIDMIAKEIEKEQDKLQQEV